MRLSPALMVSGLLIASFAALGVALCWPSGNMISRDIGCARADLGRTRAICTALSNSMEWTWLGHAIVSPGWRITWPGLRQVYCREKITAADTAALEALKHGSDWRLQDGADNLLRLVAGSGGNETEPQNSIFNPANPDYILRNGCGK